MIINVRRGRRDRDWPQAWVLTWAEAGLARGELPIPGATVTLTDGVNDQPGIIYSVHYGQLTLVVAPLTEGERNGRWGHQPHDHR